MSVSRSAPVRTTALAAYETPIVLSSTVSGRLKYNCRGLAPAAARVAGGEQLDVAAECHDRDPGAAFAQSGVQVLAARADVSAGLDRDLEIRPDLAAERVERDRSAGVGGQFQADVAGVGVEVVGPGGVERATIGEVAADAFHMEVVGGRLGDIAVAADRRERHVAVGLLDVSVTAHRAHVEIAVDVADGHVAGERFQRGIVGDVVDLDVAGHGPGLDLPTRPLDLEVAGIAVQDDARADRDGDRVVGIHVIAVAIIVVLPAAIAMGVERDAAGLVGEAHGYVVAGDVDAGFGPAPGGDRDLSGLKTEVGD